MHAFETLNLLIEQAKSGRLYHEFLRQPSMSLGLYVLPAGSADPQSPHNEDEVYVVLAGRGQIRVGAEDRVVEPGSIVFVEKQAAHKFHSITEELQVLVFFAPAESG